MVPDSTSASTATAELDDLMTSLNNFKMDERNVDEPVIGGAPNLDDMLGNLQVCKDANLGELISLIIFDYGRRT